MPLPFAPATCSRNAACSTHLDPDTVDRGVLVFSELVTNGVRHTYSTLVVVRVECPDDGAGQ